MCYHTVLIAEPEELARRYGRRADAIPDFRPAYSVSAFSHAGHPVVTFDMQMRYFRWGLIPYWTKSRDQMVTTRNLTVNAPAETIFENPYFRIPIRRRRCLIPVSGFYGWRHERDRKERYYITVKEQAVFSLAGIFDCWKRLDTDEPVMTYSIVTTEANPMMRYIDNANYRMPVILHAGDEERWLDPELTDLEIESLLKPYPDAAMLGEAVRNGYGSSASVSVPVSA